LYKISRFARNDTVFGLFTITSILHENKDIQCFQDLNEQKDISISIFKLMLPEN